jgi:hypothetical protein
MDEGKARGILQKLIDGCGRAIRDAERLARDQPDAPPIDAEWFRVMRAKSRACLSALATGDQDEFRALIEQVKAAKDEPLWPSMARVLGLLPNDDWFTDEAGPEPNYSGGERQILVHCDELAKGWLYVHAETPPTDPARLPYLLNDAFCRWLKQNPNATVRAVLPIVAGGNTVAIHVFLDTGT